MKYTYKNNLIIIPLTCMMSVKLDVCIENYSWCFFKKNLSWFQVSKKSVLPQNLNEQLTLLDIWFGVICFGIRKVNFSVFVRWKDRRRTADGRRQTTVDI